MGSIKLKPLQEAEKVAEELSKALRFPEDFNGCVMMVMADDCSQFFWDGACYRWLVAAGQTWCAVFTEHYGMHVFEKSAIAKVAYFARVHPVPGTADVE